MSFEPAQDDGDEMGGGAPPWMVTYGDSITLLLTFFVMLLTFSTPNKEGMAELARGILSGSRRVALFAGPVDQENVVAMERRLEESRLDDKGAETAPMNQTESLQELQRHYQSLDINELKELKGGRVIRIPVVELFGTGTGLTTEGGEVLDNIVKVLRAKRHSVVVHVEAGVGATDEARRQRSLGMAATITQYLEHGGGKACEDVGLSDNVELLGTPARPGTCEIILLEV